MKSTQSPVEVKSKFTLGAVSVKSVQSGERVSNETIALISTASQLNKFNINKLAAEMLGITSGNRVKLIITELPTIDGKYLIAVAKDTDGTAAKVASPSGKEGFGSLLFNYSGVWSRMVQCENVDAQEKGIAAFVEEGIAVERSKTGYINRKVSYKLMEVEDINEESPLVDPFTKEEYTKVFALVSPEIEAVDITKEATTRKPKDAATDAGEESSSYATEATEIMEE